MNPTEGYDISRAYNLATGSQLPERASESVPHSGEEFITNPAKGKRPAAFTKECVLSPELAAFLGKERMTRSDVVSSMWRTIREKCLIDPNQKQFAICDEQLFKVIGKKRFKVFGMMKYLKSHIRDPSKA
ncbi:hypothetical protein BV898_14929 [Hypsibius exemplaris]|uniref:DM2 domain-containing protein n=1 Tax=Hypsibius exemplaris TaxID=2072580 RepID=A0A9X6NGV8_HYPEX|nr:hypothetical protein BV898_14929 [Hypsibius exemplaris]